MNWVKTGTVPLMKEKKARKDIKKYFTPTSFSTIKKSPQNMSRFIKTEDRV